MSEKVSLRNYVDVRLKCIGELIAANEKINQVASASVVAKLETLKDKVNDLRVQAAVTAALVSLLMSLIIGWVKQ